jgi:flagellar hook-associated protein 3 FlgL
MNRITDAATDRFLMALNAITARADRAQRQIGSGLKISSVSDEPDQITTLLTARAELDQTTQILANLGRAKAEVDTAEQALEVAVSGVEHALVSGAQGATSTQTPAQRATIAADVAATLEHLVAIAGTTVESRHVFSGDDYDAIPYAVDLTQPNGVTAYAGGAATREMLHPSGLRFSIAKSAEEIFDNSAPGASVFGALNALRLALEDGPTVAVGDPDYEAQFQAQTSAIDAALLNLRSAQTHLGNMLSYYGSVQNRVAEATETGHKLKLRGETTLSGIQDADITEAALELAQATTQRDAALAARARQGLRSLFDYLG